jgi:hypothetical protein
MQIDSGLAELHLKEVDGDDVRLGDIWANQTTVLVWLRHYR